MKVYSQFFWILFLSKKIFKQNILISIVAIYLAKECIVNDYENVIIYSLLIFLLLLYFYIINNINNTFENIIKNIEKEYKKLIFITILIERKINKLLFLYNIFYYIKKFFFYTFNKSLITYNFLLKNKIISYNLNIIQIFKIKNFINVIINRLITRFIIGGLFNSFKIIQSINIDAKLRYCD